MKLSKLTKLEQTGLISVVIIFGCIIYFKKVYQPLHKKFTEIKKQSILLSEEVKTLKWEMGSKEKIQSSIKERKEELRDARAAFNKAREIISGREDLSLILTEISGLAGRYRLKIQTFSPVTQKKTDDKDEDDEQWSHSQHRLIIVGQFPDFKAFLKELGYLPKLVTVDEVSVERDKKNRALTFRLLLSI